MGTTASDAMESGSGVAPVLGDGGASPLVKTPVATRPLIIAAAANTAAIAAR